MWGQGGLGGRGVGEGREEGWRRGVVVETHIASCVMGFQRVLGSISNELRDRFPTRLGERFPTSWQFPFFPAR